MKTMHKIIIGNKRLDLVSAAPDPEYVIYVGRPSVLGNPYSLAACTRLESIRLYKDYFYKYVNTIGDSISMEVERLINLYKKHGRLVLVCWCAPKSCHAEVIREYIMEQMKKE